MTGVRRRVRPFVQVVVLLASVAAIGLVLAVEHRSLIRFLLLVAYVVALMYGFDR